MDQDGFLYHKESTLHAVKISTRRRSNWIAHLHNLLSNPLTSRWALVWGVLVVGVVVTLSALFMSLSNADLDLGPGCEMCAPVRGKDRLDEAVVAARALLAAECRRCEPEAQSSSPLWEAVLAAFLAAEFALRLCTAPFSTANNPPNTAVATAADANPPTTTTTTTTRLWALGKLGAARTVRFLRDPLNALDLFASVLFVVASSFRLGFGGLAMLVRLFRAARLVRLLRLFRFRELMLGLEMGARVFANTASFFLTFLVFSGVLVLVLAGLVMVGEKGEWDSATGEFLRPALNFTEGDEPSPFTNLGMALWWCVVTMTLVGYGRIVPSTPFGIFVGGFACIVGVVLLAMPVTIMGYNLSREVRRENAQRRQRNEQRRRLREILSRYLDGDLGTVRFCFEVWLDRTFPQAPVVVREEMQLALREGDLPARVSLPETNHRPLGDAGEEGHEGMLMWMEDQMQRHRRRLRLRAREERALVAKRPNGLS